MPGSTSKCWVITVNNPSDPAVLLEDYSDVRYAIWQLESGENHTPHLQGYVEWKNKKSLSACVLQHGHAHWSPRRGSRDQARDYCRKEETRVSGTDGPWEHGEWANGQGARTDLLHIKRKIDEGVSDKVLWEENPATMLRTYKGWERYRQVKIDPRTVKTQVTVIWGPTGTGKSYWVDKQAGPDAFWLHPSKDDNGCWWDGYMGQETVVMDEFYGGIKWTQMLRLLDAYPMSVPVKGAMIQFAAKRIFITSNKNPRDWYSKQDYPTLHRRLEKIARLDLDCDRNQVWSLTKGVWPAEDDCAPHHVPEEEEVLSQ